MPAVAHHPPGGKIALAARAPFPPLRQRLRFDGDLLLTRLRLIGLYHGALRMNAAARIRRRPTDRAHRAGSSNQLRLRM